MMLSGELQVLRDPRSSALMHFRDDASAAQRAADASGLVPHALVRLLRSEDRLAVREGDAHPLADRVRLFARERENVAQEGFDPLIHPPQWKVNTEALYGAFVLPLELV
jgi:hypothetical protein